MTEVDNMLVGQPATGRPDTTKGDLLVVLTAVAGALTAWAFWTQVAGIELAVDTADGARPVVAVDVALAALVSSVVGVLLLRVFQARSPRGLRRWTVVAGVVCALSLLGPLGGASAPAVAALMSLHVLVGAVVVLGARRARAVTA